MGKEKGQGGARGAECQYVGPEYADKRSNSRGSYGESPYSELSRQTGHIRPSSRSESHRSVPVLCGNANNLKDVAFLLVHPEDHR